MIGTLGRPIEEEGNNFLFHNTSRNIYSKYNVEGCQKSLSHPSWPSVVTNKYDMTTNGEGPYPGIAPGGYSIHCTNTNPSPYPGANPG